MGWGSGSEVASGMVDLCLEYVPRHSQKPFLVEAFRTLESLDWDTHMDILGNKHDPSYDLIHSVFREMHPTWYQYEEDEPEVKYDS